MKTFVSQALVGIIGLALFFLISKHPLIIASIAIGIIVFCFYLYFARSGMRKKATPENIYSVVQDAGFEKYISLHELTTYLEPVLRRKNFIKDDITAVLFELFSEHNHTLYFDHRWEPADVFEKLKIFFPELTYIIERCESRDGGYSFSAVVSGSPISSTYAVTPDDMLFDLNAILSEVTGHSLYSVPLVADGSAFLVTTPDGCEKLKKNRYF